MRERRIDGGEGGVEGRGIEWGGGGIKKRRRCEGYDGRSQMSVVYHGDISQSLRYYCVSLFRLTVILHSEFAKLQ